MRRKLAVAVAVAMIVVMALSGAPRRAAASDNLAIIIPSAITGVVVVVVVIAIVMSDRTDKEFELAATVPPEPAPPGIKLAPDCKPTESGLPLLCW